MQNKKAIKKKVIGWRQGRTNPNRHTFSTSLYMHGQDFTGQWGTIILQTMLAGLLQKEMIHYDICLKKVQIIPAYFSKAKKLLKHSECSYHIFIFNIQLQIHIFFSLFLLLNRQFSLWRICKQKEHKHEELQFKIKTCSNWKVDNRGEENSQW